MPLLVWKLLQSRVSRVRFAFYLFAITSVLISALYTYGGIMGDAYFLILGTYLIFITSIVVRRLHDINLRGWWSLLIPAMFIAYQSILFVCGWGGCEESMMLFFMTIPWIGAVLVFALMAIPGTNDINRFGPPSSL